MLPTPPGVSNLVCIRGRLALLVALCGLAACAGSANRLPQGPVDPESLRTLSVLPLNVVVAMPGELEEGAAPVEAALLDYLEASGKQVERISFAKAHDAWVSSAADLRKQVGPQGEVSFEGAARHLALRLRKQQEFDALIVPLLAFRPADLRTRFVSWDGVERSLETVGEVRQKGSTVFSNSFHGKITAPSLIVFVFSPSGELIFQGTGGLDLAHRARIFSGKTMSETTWQLELRPELFPDESLLREGVAVAFDRLLPRVDESE